MPNRIIKESICTSDSLDQLTAFQETFFYRLIVNCDDYGRMDARPKILASSLFPLKDLRTAQIEDALRALTSAELVTLYTVGGKPFLQMNSWNRHQRVRDSKEKYPGMEKADVRGELPQVAASCGLNPIQSESNPKENTTDTAYPPYSCSERSSEPVAATLTLLDGTVYEITESEADKDAKAYPSVDVRREYLVMERWNQANPTKRKTRKGIRRFINSWLEREQNKGMGGGGMDGDRRYHQADHGKPRTEYGLRTERI